jgi:KUP system potassium uptake protein
LDLNFGFNDEPNMHEAFNYCLKCGMDFDSIYQASFYLGKETIVPIGGKEMALWRERIFAVMKQNATSAIEYYKIPADRVIEIGGRHVL